MIKLEAACYLFEVTGDIIYRDYFDAMYTNCHLIEWNFAYPFEALNQEVLLYYTTLENGTLSVQNNIKNKYKNAIINSTDNMAAYTTLKDPYLAYIKDYTWGSNSIKSLQGSMNYNLITYGMADGIEETAKDAAEVYIHYIHGVNPSYDCMDTTSNSTGTDYENSGKIFIIYPNPVSGMLNISNKQDYQYRLIIYDLPGNKIIDGVFKGNVSIDTSHLAQGYYEIIISHNDKTIRQKLIKI